MASYSARLEVDGQQYPVVLCTYSFTQATGARGRVSERVRHGLLELVLDVPAGDQLLHWAATPHYPLDGHVSFYQSSELMAHETVSFKAGQCVSYQEVFEAGADLVGSYRCALTIAAPKLELTAGGPPGSTLPPAAAGTASTVKKAAAVAGATVLAAGASSFGKPVGGRGPTGFGDTRGEYSGRLYDAENCGGPIQKLDWRPAIIQDEGIQTIKKHIGRFSAVQANEKMIVRLEQIAQGSFSASDYDKRYYTHELREHERYKALEVPDGLDPGYEVWNDTHSATLEDYQLDERKQPLYHPTIQEEDFL